MLPPSVCERFSGRGVVSDRMSETEGIQEQHPERALVKEVVGDMARASSKKDNRLSRGP
jgi:hypothetical protein